MRHDYIIILVMTKHQLFEYYLDAYGISPDYPFDEGFETVVLRHADNRKWYAIIK